MATPIPAAPRLEFHPDGTVRALSTLLTAVGLLLVIAGLTLPLLLPVDTVAEGFRRGGLAAILRVGVGASLVLGSRWLRQGRRHGVAVLTAALVIISTNALVVRGWRGAVVASVAGVLLVPLLRRWRTLA